MWIIFAILIVIVAVVFRAQFKRRSKRRDRKAAAEYRGLKLRHRGDSALTKRPARGQRSSRSEAASTLSVSQSTVDSTSGIRLTITTSLSNGPPGLPQTASSVSRKESAEAEGLRWVPFDHLLKVQGLTIPNAGTYTSKSGSRGTATDPSEIIRDLAAKSQSNPLHLDYWPWYCRLTSGQRWQYLTWLSTGRDQLPSEDGYLFIYYYGLERRVLVDKADLDVVCSEVMRLRRLHLAAGLERTNSFRGYSAALLWFLAVRDASVIPPTFVASLAGQTTNWGEDNLAAMLSWCARKDMSLGAGVAMAVASVLPQSQRSVVIKRVGDEFKQLFAKRYKAEYGAGLELQAPARERTFTYRPASDGLGVHSCKGPNPWGQPAQFDGLADLWNGCVADLKGLSRVSASGGTEDEWTVDRWQAMPPELRAGVDHPLTDVVCQLVADHHTGGAECILSVGKLARVVGVEPTARLSVVQSRRLAQVFYDVGYALEPDARLTGQGYYSDDEVAVFLRVDDQEPDAGRYAGAAWTLRLGMAIAEADGETSEDEIRKVTGAIHETFELNDADRRRLEALRAVLLRSASDLSGLGKKVQAALSPPARQILGQLLVAVAAADGEIQPKELAALRKCFRAMELSPDQLDAAIAEVSPKSHDGLVVAAAGTPAVSGEPIPSPPPGIARLNREAVRRILAETEQVRRVLAEAMTTTDEPLARSIDRDPVAFTPVPPAVVIAASAPVAGPALSPVSGWEGVSPTPPGAVATPQGSELGTKVRDQAETAPVVGTANRPGAPAATVANALPQLRPQFGRFFAELTTRPAWSLQQAKELAQRHGVMLSGAVEAINEAAFDAFGQQLVFEDGDILTVESGLLG